MLFSSYISDLRRSLLSIEARFTNAAVRYLPAAYAKFLAVRKGLHGRLDFLNFILKYGYILLIRCLFVLQRILQFCLSSRVVLRRGTPNSTCVLVYRLTYFTSKRIRTSSAAAKNRVALNIYCFIIAQADPRDSAHARLIDTGFATRCSR